MNERHRKKRLNALRYVLAMPRSILFNLRVLPLRQAVRVPLLISHRTRIENLGGKVTIDAADIKTGLVEIGFNTYQGSDFRYDRTHINIRGRVVFRGKCTIGAGCCLEVAEEGTLDFGDHTNLGPKTLVICHKGITFGNNARASWCCTFMDTDQHRLVDTEGHHCNPDHPILIGDNVWIGCHVIVAKGTSVASNTTVGAGTCLAGKYDESMTVLAGVPAKVVRRGVKREL